MDDSSPQEEKRKHARFRVDGQDITCRMFTTSDVELLNLSLGGALIATHDRLAIGQAYTLSIQRDDSMFKIHGTVVWEHLARNRDRDRKEDRPTYEVGIRFDDVLTSQGANLVQFIDANMQSSQFHSRLHGLRVRIGDPSSAKILDVSRLFTPEILSLGGMLLCSDHPLTEGRMIPMDIVAQDLKQTVPVKARIVHCDPIPDSRPLRYHAGIEFADLTESTREGLEQITRRLAATPS